MRSDRVPSTRHDDGFTLVELIIVVALMGVLMPAVALVFTVVVRNTPSVQTRADDSRSTRGLSTWLPQDVLSTPPALVTDINSNAPGYTISPGKASGCSSATGTNVLHMVWQENAGTLITYVANYRYITSGGNTQIKRFSCSGTGSPPFSNTRAMNVTTSIQASSAAATTTPSPTDSTRVAFVDVKAFTSSGVEVLIHAASRNPAEQLPA